MKTTTALLAFCGLFTSCSSSNTTPVDMEYRGTVDNIENTCGNNPTSDGLIFTIDVALKTDGTMTISYPRDYIPGEGRYSGLVLRDGKVNNKPATPGSDNEVVSIVGSLTMEAADLTIEEYRPPFTYAGTNYPSCVRKAHVYGTARNFWDADAFDGKYEANYTFYGNVCPTDPALPNPEFWTVPLDVVNHGDSTIFAFNSHDENLLFEMRTENLASGNVNWSGDMYLLTPPFGWDEFTGNVVGTFSNETYSLNLSFHDISDTSGCDYILRASGAKRAPDLDRIDNIYRLAISKTDSCSPNTNGNPTTETVEQEGAIVFMQDGRLTLMYGTSRTNLEKQADGTFGGHWESVLEKVDYTLSVTPPNLSFSYVF